MSRVEGAASAGCGETRERILEAMLEIASEHGYEETRVDEVVGRAEATREQFDRLFSSKEECSIAVFDRFMTGFYRQVFAAYEGEPSWPDNLRAAAYAVADWMSAHPREWRFGAIGLLWAGELAQARRETAFQSFAEMIDAGRAHAEDPDAVPAFTAEGVIGAIAEMITRRAQGDSIEPIEYVPSLMATAVRPYLGEEAAARELEIPPPRPASAVAAAGYRAGVGKREPKGEVPEQPLSRLPRGRHGLPRELVVENQRQRLVSGIVEAVAEHGFGGTTIAHITAAAQLSRRTFYEHFDNKEDCFEAAYEAIFDYLRGKMDEAMARQDEWPERVRAGVGALLETLSAHPDMARFFLVAPASAGDEIADRHHQAMRELVGGLIAGAPQPEGDEELSEAGEQAIAGGISRLVVRRLNGDEAEQLPALLPALVEQTLRPFLGGEEAARLAGCA